MTAPTVNGVKYPQPVDELLPAARKLVDELGAVPSRNRLMREYRIGAPKAVELLARLRADADGKARTAMISRGALPVDDQADVDEPTADPWRYAEPVAPDLGTAPPPPTHGPAVDVAPTPPAGEPVPQSTAGGHPGTPTRAGRIRPVAVWPVVLLALPAFVAVWSGWVGLGGLTGFGVVHPLPGIWDSLAINTAITLPVGVETYGAYALYVWLSGRVPARARRFAKWSALGSLAVGALGQVAYHLLVAAGVQSAPWWITTAVSVLPVAVLGMGAALAHLVREDH
ncbi:ABC transporter permease [Micromonospora sp. WMMD1082]|uniref:ABC transporter permease n=1 Tax=Micromonospora sp. WMMD1082 TaxID=3016104 RepID=UPI002415D10B|nr:ABC transporter permease [Micromonospora sp. WMMD1082]MDG4792435.1 ABC transporter permease [Micromonospora sp. WMMD1082]